MAKVDVIICRTDEESGIYEQTKIGKKILKAFGYPNGGHGYGFAGEDFVYEVDKKQVRSFVSRARKVVGRKGTVTV